MPGVISILILLFSILLSKSAFIHISICMNHINIHIPLFAVADPPDKDSIHVVFVLYPNMIVHSLDVTWTPVVGRHTMCANDEPFGHLQGGSVTMYTVRVVGDGTFVGNGSTTCTTSPCIHSLYLKGYVSTTNYTIFIASINGDGDIGPENFSTING